MSRFVLDASLTMALCLREGTDQQAETVRRLLETEDTYMPEIWAAEVRNSLVTAERRGRISPEEVEAWFDILERSPVTIDFNPDHWATLAFARAHSLTFYDALYLELALRRQATLASLDDALVRAADAQGMPLLQA